MKTISRKYWAVIWGTAPVTESGKATGRENRLGRHPSAESDGRGAVRCLSPGGHSVGDRALDRAGYAETLGEGLYSQDVPVPIFRLKNYPPLRIWTFSTRTRKFILVKRRRKYF